MQVKNLSGGLENWLNCIQLVGKVGGDGSRSAENVWNTFVSVWGRIFSMPEVLVLDPGTEFQGHFAEMVASNGTACCRPTLEPLGRMAAQSEQEKKLKCKK